MIFWYLIKYLHFLILWYFDIWFDNEHDFHICWFGKINLALSYIILYYDIFHIWFLEFGESNLALSHIILYYNIFLKFGESYLALSLSAGTYHRLRVFPSSRCSEEMTIRKSRIILRFNIHQFNDTLQIFIWTCFQAEDNLFPNFSKKNSTMAFEFLEPS